ncbi:unnamed protein product, partial [Rotaria sp. Silwood2]
MEDFQNTPLALIEATTKPTLPAPTTLASVFIDILML